MGQSHYQVVSTSPIGPAWSTAISENNENTIQQIYGQAGSLSGNILLLGGPNRGQASFSSSLINNLIANNEKPVIIDADLAQQQIASPCCAGYGVAEVQLQSLSQISPIRSIFVGASSPESVAFQYLSGIGTLLQEIHPMRWIMTTGDYALSVAAQHLLNSLIQLSNPSHIVAFQRNSELEPLISIYDNTVINIHRMVYSQQHTTISPTYGIARRALFFRSYFQNSSLFTFSLKEIPISGTWLGRGTPFPSYMLKYIRQCFSPSIHVYYGETWGNDVGLVLSEKPDLLSPAVSLALNEVRAQNCNILVAKQLKNLLLGAQSEKNRFLGMGILKGLDLKRGCYSILTPVLSSLAINHFIAGRMSVNNEGYEQQAQI